MKKGLVVVAGAAMALAGPPAGAQLPSDLAARFAYDQSRPLDVKVEGTEDRDDVRIQDLTYASPKGGRVPAYLVVPAGKGPFAAVLFLHPGQGNRSTFLEEAITLARGGIVGLTIDASFLRPASDSPPPTPPNLNTHTIQTVVDLRRGVDLLVARHDVDRHRIGYVGHSLGATLGGILLALDNRIPTSVLMAGDPIISEWWRETEQPFAVQIRRRLTPERFDRWIESLAPFDTIHFIGHAASVSLLFQFARQDEFVSEEAALRYFDVAPKPKVISWYDTGHFFNEKARSDRIAWLKMRLTAMAQTGRDGSAFDTSAHGEPVVKDDHADESPDTKSSAKMPQVELSPPQTRSCQVPGL